MPPVINNSWWTVLLIGYGLRQRWSVTRQNDLQQFLWQSFGLLVQLCKPDLGFAIDFYCQRSGPVRRKLADGNPRWTPSAHFSGDGKWVYFTAEGQVYRVPAQAAGSPEPITEFTEFA